MCPAIRCPTNYRTSPSSAELRGRCYARHLTRATRATVTLLRQPIVQRAGHVRACAGMCRYGWQARLHVGCDGAEATGVQTRT